MMEIDGDGWMCTDVYGCVWMCTCQCRRAEDEILSHLHGYDALVLVWTSFRLVEKFLGLSGDPDMAE